MDAVKKIEIVEDEAMTAMLLARNLRLVGYSTCGPVSTGEAAIQLAGEERPDVVLMDIRLAGAMDGIQAAADIKQRWGIPVIFMTGYSDADTMERAGTR